MLVTSRTFLKKHLALLLAATLLGACSGSGSPGSAAPTSTSGSATASLGVVANAGLNVLAADGMTILTTGETDAAGVAVYQLSSYDGPVIIEIFGDSDASYYDEASGTALAFGPGRRLRAIAPAAGGDIAVTALTELAYQLAESRVGLPLTASAINAANNDIRLGLAPGLVSILSPPTGFDASTTSDSLADTEAGRYALVLAALAELASGDATPALAVLDALSADLADGEIDGQNNGSPITDVPYADFINEMRQALEGVASDFGTAALQASAASQAPASTRVDGGGGSTDGPNGTTRAATVHASLVGQYTLRATANQPGSPYSDDEMVLAEVSGNNTLQIGDGPVLGNPFERQTGASFNTLEIVWLDADRQLEYALSSNASGVFNEINVGDASAPGAHGMPAFLSQLVEAGSGGSDIPNLDLVQALAGSYTVSNVESGSHNRMTVTISGNGDVDYDSGISLATDSYDAVYDRLDCCNRITIETTANGTGPRIDLFVNASDELTEVEYFPAGFGSSGGSRVSVAASGNGGDSELGNGLGATGLVAGERLTLTPENTFQFVTNEPSVGYFTIFAQSNSFQEQWTIQAPRAVGTHACRDETSNGANDDIEMSVNDGDGLAIADGTGVSSCQIIITRVTPTIEGIFSGSFSRGGSSLQVTDGEFRANPSQ